MSTTTPKKRRACSKLVRETFILRHKSCGKSQKTVTSLTGLHLNQYCSGNPFEDDTNYDVCSNLNLMFYKNLITKNTDNDSHSKTSTLQSPPPLSKKATSNPPVITPPPKVPNPKQASAPAMRFYNRSITKFQDEVNETVANLFHQVQLYESLLHEAEDEIATLKSEPPIIPSDEPTKKRARYTTFNDKLIDYYTDKEKCKFRKPYRKLESDQQKARCESIMIQLVSSCLERTKFKENNSYYQQNEQVANDIMVMINQIIFHLEHKLKTPMNRNPDATPSDEQLEQDIKTQEEVDARSNTEVALSVLFDSTSKKYDELKNKLNKGCFDLPSYWKMTNKLCPAKVECVNFSVSSFCFGSPKEMFLHHK
jgi:hypothetical protein